MKEQWQELKETIIEIRDNNKCNEDVSLLCRFLINYMGVLGEQIQEPCEYAPFTIDELKNEDMQKLLRGFKNQQVNPTKTGWHIAHGMYEDRFWCSCGFIKVMDSSMREWEYCPVCGRTRMEESEG